MSVALVMYIKRRRQVHMLPPPVIATNGITSQVSEKSVSMVPPPDVAAFRVDVSSPKPLPVDVGATPSLPYDLQHLVQITVDPRSVAEPSSTRLPLMDVREHNRSIDSSSPSSTLCTCPSMTSQDCPFGPKVKQHPCPSDLPPLSTIASNGVLSTLHSPINSPDTPAFILQSLREVLNSVDNPSFANSQTHDQREDIEEEETEIIHHLPPKEEGDDRCTATGRSVTETPLCQPVADDGCDNFGLSGSDSDRASTAADCETEDSVTTEATDSPEGDKALSVSSATPRTTGIVQHYSPSHRISLVVPTPRLAPTSAPTDFPILDRTSVEVIYPRAEDSASRSSRSPVLPDAGCTRLQGTEPHKPDVLENDRSPIGSDSDCGYSQEDDSNCDTGTHRNPFIYDKDYVPRPLRKLVLIQEGSGSIPLVLSPTTYHEDARHAGGGSNSKHSQDDDDDYESEADRDPLAYDKDYVPAPLGKRRPASVSSLPLPQPTMPLNIGFPHSRPRIRFASLSYTMTFEASQLGSSGTTSLSGSSSQGSVLRASLQEMHEELDAAVAEVTRRGCDPVDRSKRRVHSSG
ncbi:hypothetical protein FRB99_001357 [Tulasnella sp. 403]|nr:hypothetical protein FRB99_001357 [Tulasnella sp. 403]